MAKFRCGVIGAGFMGKNHAQRLARHPLAELVAMADTDTEKAGAIVREVAPQARFHATGHEMLAAEKLDALYVALPPFAHAGEVEAAAAKGLHVFLEKPLAISSARAQTMVTAIERAGVVSQVGFHLRFLKSVTALKKAIDEGAAGRPTLFSGRYWTRMDGSDWWRDRGRSGGQALEQIIHMYDLAMFLFGPLAEAQGVAANLTHLNRADYTIEDTSLGVARFRNGALAVVTGSNCAVDMHFFGDFRVVCEHLTLDHVCAGQTWVAPDRATFYRSNGQVETLVEDGDPYGAETDDFLAAIRGKRPALTPVRQGLEAMRVAEKVRDGNLLPLP